MVALTLSPLRLGTGNAVRALVKICFVALVALSVPSLLQQEQTMLSGLRSDSGKA